VLGDGEAVRPVPVDPADRLPVLARGDVDLVSCNLSWTLGREARHPVLFAGVTCYDGEGFLVRRADRLRGPLELAGRRIAVQAGTTSAANLARWFGTHGTSVTAVPRATPAAALAAYESGDCAAYVLDRIALAGERRGLEDPDAHRILDETISREPMALAVHAADPAWFVLCRWVLNLLVAAEYAARWDAGTAGPDAARTAVAETAGAHGAALGLDDRWAARALAAVGDYGDVYARNLGTGSGLAVPRGLNELWVAGGLHYALPVY
jgi:general L-amino acid transport system substrate-binding protein